MHRIAQLVKVDPTLVRHRMEHVAVLDRALFHSKDQIDPEVDVFRDIVRFKSFTILRKIFGGRMRPFGQFNVVNSFTVGSHAKIKPQLVGEKGGVVHVELRRELLDVAWVVQRAVPLFFDALEESVRVVVLAALELDHPLRVLPNQEANHISRAAVMSPVEIALFVW